ncbi:MAG TPA: phosphotransferase [Burkholderiales bacterium]|nr:phosphotransferase [Burkholderiales bacterium]
MDRAAALERWIAEQIPGRNFTLASASADASFRRYFRVRFGEETLIAMDAPPAREDCRPFVKVAQLMAEAGVHVPRVLAQDIERGFLLLSDLGSTTYLEALNEANADALFGDAVDALLRWQSATRPGVLPPYDEALLRRELELFPAWYVHRHLGIELTAAQQAALESIFRLLTENATRQPAVFVHRDFMPRNLMLSEPNPGVLDFQDAVCGPIAYDIVSLFRDAFISWDEDRVLDWTIRYWEKARAARLPVREDFAQFYREFEWTGLQRHLKVLGIFARIRYRDGKPGYLEDTPRFVRYVRACAGRYDALAPLLRLFDQLENRARQVGLSF